MSSYEHATRRRRLLMTAYHFNREFSMESRLSWNRAHQAADEFDVTVICARTDQLADSPPATDERRVHTAVLPLTRWERALMSNAATYYAGYRRWHRRVARLAQRLHAGRPFDLVHHVSFCGYREPGGGSALGVPFVWGPVGGTHPFPVRFLPELDFRAAVRELVRNAVNWAQLRFDRRVRRAMREAAEVLAANREVARDLASAFGLAPRVQLETGIAERPVAERPGREAGRPLRILWSGRLRAWKGLPILLRALAQLPRDCRYELRVLGAGPCLARWQRLATRLGLSERVEWAGWPCYSAQLAHYDWADVFAFTSLRDTSGTGLLEALAAGAPIIGLDHQGAADIMTTDCAVKVPATSRRAAVEGFREGLERLAADGEWLDKLRAGARERSRRYGWDCQWEFFRETYARAMRQSRPAPVEPEVARVPSESARPVAAMSHEALC